MTFGKLGARGGFGSLGLLGGAGSLPALAPGPATVVPGAIGAFGQAAMVTGYTGNLIDVVRPSDNTTQTFTASAGGRIPIAQLASFLNDGSITNGIGYVTKRYCQDGSGNDATQTVLAKAPRIDLNKIVNGIPALIYDFTYRQYMASLLTFPVTSFSGAVLTMTNPIQPWMAVGQSVSGTNLTSTLITAIDYANRLITVAVGPTGAVGNLTFTQPQMWMDLPAGISIGLNTHAIFSIGTQPNLQTWTQPVTVGTAASTVLGTANNYAMLRVGGFSTISQLRLICNSAGVNASFSLSVPLASFTPHSAPATYGFTRLGAVMRYWAEDKASSATVGADPGAGTLTGGSLGFSQQFTAAGNVFGGDYESYGDLIYPADIGATNGTLLKTACDTWLVVNSTGVHSVVEDGSSTTRGTGNAVTNNPARKLATLLGSSVRALDLGQGQSIEAMLQNYATNGPGAFFNSTSAKLLVVHPGLGNSLQAQGNFTITGVAGAVLTISTSMAYPSFASLGATVTVSGGGASVPAGTTITAVNSPNSPTTVTLSNAPTGGTPTTMTVVNSTGAQAWANIIAYLQLARTTGYKILLVGSATRGTFTAGQQTEFDNAKALMAANALTYADAYLDLSSIPQFAGAGAATPWLTNPLYWQADTQHFTDLGYSLISANENAALVAAGLAA